MLTPFSYDTKDFFTDDKNTKYLILKIFEDISSPGLDLYLIEFQYSGPGVNEKNLKTSGIDLALELSNSLQNLVILCSFSDYGDDLEKNQDKFSKLLSKKNASFFNGMLLKSRVLDNYKNLLVRYYGTP